MEKSEIKFVYKALIEKYRAYSNEALLVELTSLPVLPDEKDPGWKDLQTWVDLACPYLALAHIMGERRLEGAIIPLLEKASYGDPGEIMQGLRHTLERIVDPDWPLLVRICVQVSKSPYRGARLWAIRELGILRDSTSFDTLSNAIKDEELIHEEACMALEMLCQTNPDYLPRAEQVLKDYISIKNNDFQTSFARKALSKIQQMKGAG